MLNALLQKTVYRQANGNRFDSGIAEALRGGSVDADSLMRECFVSQAAAGERLARIASQFASSRTTPDELRCFRARARALAVELGAGETAIEDVTQRKAAETYETVFEDMVAKGFVSDERLNDVAAATGLKSAGTIGAKKAQSLLSATISAVLADNPICDVETEEVARLNALLKVDPGPELTAQISRARTLFKVESHPLEPVSAPYKMQRGELCFATVVAEASEVRTRRARTGYSGPVYRLRITKGLSYRVGSIKTYPQDESYSHSFGTGMLAITNKRLIISLPNRNMTVRLSAIIDVEYFSDGLRVHKETGKPIVLTYEDDATIAVVLSRLLDDGAPLA